MDVNGVRFFNFFFQVETSQNAEFAEIVAGEMDHFQQNQAEILGLINSSAERIVVKRDDRKHSVLELLRWEILADLWLKNNKNRM